MPVIPVGTDAFLPVDGGVVHRYTGTFYPYNIIECHDTTDSIFDEIIWPILPITGFFIHSISLAYSAEVTGICPVTRMYVHIVSPPDTYIPIATLPCTGIDNTSSNATSLSQTFDIDYVCPLNYGIHFTSYLPNPSAFSMTMTVASLTQLY